MLLPTLEFKSVELVATGNSASLCCFVRTPHFCVTGLGFSFPLRLEAGSEFSAKRHKLLTPETKQGAVQEQHPERQPRQGTQAPTSR